MALTITIPGAVEATIGATAPAILTIGVGVPGATGAQGPQGDPGEGVPTGGSTGQALVKLDGTDYNTGWSSLPGFLTKAGNLAGLASRNTARDNLNLGETNTPRFASVNAYQDQSTNTDINPGFIQLKQEGFGEIIIRPELGIQFTDLTQQTTAWNDAPSDGVIYGRQDGSWVTTNTGDYLPLAGGAMNTNSEVTIAETSGHDIELAGWGLGVQLSADNTQGTIVEYNGLDTYDGSGHLIVTPTGITFPDSSVQTTAFTNVYLPLAGGTMTGDIYFDVGNPYGDSFINYNNLYLSADSSQDGTTAGAQSYAQYGINGLTISAQNWISDGLGGFEPTFTNGSKVTGYGLTFVNFDGTARASTVQYLATGITFPNASVQTIAFPGFNNTALTGNPTAPTPATSDNDTSIATTAYVKAQAFGDRYLSSSTTSNPVSNGNKTFTIGTGLSYTPTQNLTISYDAGNHMHGEVLTYNSGTGVLTVDIKNHTGAGTYASWVVNVGGVTPATSVAWGDITGTLSTQTDLRNALDLKSNLASPTFTGTPSLPTGTIATTQSPGNNTTALATTAFVTAAVPAFATIYQARDGTSTTLAVNPAGIGQSLMDPCYRGAGFSQNAISGTGATVTLYNLNTQRLIGPTLLAGYSLLRTNDTNNAYLNYSLSRGLGTSTVSFAKPYIFSFRLNATTVAGNTIRFKTGQSSTNTGGDPTIDGFGIRIVGTGAVELQCFKTGPGLTNITSSFTPTSGISFDVIISSNNGTVLLYINDTLVATNTDGPTSANAFNTNSQIEVIGSGTQASSTTALVSNLKIFNGA